MSIATVTSKGQITLPKELRERLHIAAGERIEFRIDEESSTATLIPLNKRVEDLFGMLKRKNNRKAVTTEKMDESIRTEIRKKYS
jgi:AbrB family looped-hinge helix DNA binding protein